MVILSVNFMAFVLQKKQISRDLSLKEISLEFRKCDKQI